VDYKKIAEEMMNKFAASHHHSPINRFQRFSRGETLALNYLAKKETPITAGDFCNVMQASSARVAALIKTLEEKGLVERSRSARDRRQVMVSITEEGRELISNRRQEMIGQLAEVFRQMGPEDTKEFIRLSEKFMQIMSGEFNHGEQTNRRLL